MTAKIESALNLLRIVRQETPAIGVAVSFGKDSMATLDLCCRVFERVEGYYLFRVRGLALVDQWAEAVRRRWGVTVRMYPHFDLSRCYTHAVLAPHWSGVGQIPRVKMPDIEAAFRRDAHVTWIAYGWRRNDSLSRALIMRRCAGYDPASLRVFPIRSWRRPEVYAYLEEQKIPRPDGLGRKDQGGLDFHPEALRTLRDAHPEDWARWRQDFPFSDVQILAAETAAASADQGAAASARAPIASAVSDSAHCRPRSRDRRDKTC